MSIQINQTSYANVNYAVIKLLPIYTLKIPVSEMKPG